MNESVCIEIFTSDRHRVACGEEFEVNASFSMEVEECRNYSEAEQDRMFTSLVRDWESKARAICGEHEDCTEPQILETRELTNTCEESIWSITLTMKTKCDPL